MEPVSQDNHYDYYAFLEQVLGGNPVSNGDDNSTDSFDDYYDGGGHANGSGFYPQDYEYDLFPADLTAKDLLPPDLPGTVKSLFLVAYVVIMFLSIVGNSLVIVVIGRNQKMRTVTNMFLLSLAVSDMLVAVLNMPFQLNFYLQNEWTLGEFLCKFSKYIQGVVIVVSIFTLAAIALDR